VLLVKASYSLSLALELSFRILDLTLSHR